VSEDGGKAATSALPFKRDPRGKDDNTYFRQPNCVEVKQRPVGVRRYGVNSLFLWGVNKNPFEKAKENHLAGNWPFLCSFTGVRVGEATNAARVNEMGIN
jgi:hypothetical protein